MSNDSKHPSGLPLPKHFEEKEAANGRKYYINHKDETTSWVDPRDAMSKKLTWAECEEDEVPFGWEIGIHNGHKYWIDHNNQTNTIDDPRLSENRKEQEAIVKDRVDALKKSMTKNKQTLRKSKQKLEEAKERMEQMEKATEEEDGEADAEEAQRSRMEYRRQLSMHTRVEREVEEGEAKIEALEHINFEEMSVKAAGEVKAELDQLNENLQKEVEEKNRMKAELQELKELVKGYMSKMHTTADESHKAVIEQENEDAREKIKQVKSLERLNELNLEEAKQAEDEAKQAVDEAKEDPPAGAEPEKESSAQTSPAMSSIAIKMELEQKKLENLRHQKEMEELRAAQKELRLLKEKHAAAEDAIKEEEVPDWLFSSHVVKLLDLKNHDEIDDDQLEEEIKERVAEYKEQQKNNADGLNFKSKLDFFTTLEIHDSVQRRKSQHQKKGPSRAVSRRRSNNVRPPSMVLRDDFPRKNDDEENNKD